MKISRYRSIRYNGRVYRRGDEKELLSAARAKDAPKLDQTALKRKGVIVSDSQAEAEDTQAEDERAEMEAGMPQSHGDDGEPQ